MTMFRNQADRIKDSPIVVPLMTVSSVLFIVGLMVSGYNVSTTHTAIGKMPITALDDTVVWGLSLVPTLGPIMLFFVFLENRKQLGALLLGGFLHFVDMATAMLFLMPEGQPVTIGSLVLTFIVAECVFTFGSTVLVLFCFNACVALAPYFMRNIGKILAAMSGSDEQAEGQPSYAQPPHMSYPPNISVTRTPPPAMRPALADMLRGGFGKPSDEDDEEKMPGDPRDIIAAAIQQRQRGQPPMSQTRTNLPRLGPIPARILGGMVPPSQGNSQGGPRHQP